MVIDFGWDGYFKHQYYKWQGFFKSTMYFKEHYGFLAEGMAKLFFILFLAILAYLVLAIVLEVRKRKLEKIWGKKRPLL